MGMASGAGSVVVKTMLNVLLVPILLHTLGIEIYGLYVLLLGLLELALVMDMGFTSAMVKILGEFKAAHDTQHSREVLAIGHTLYVVMSVLVLVVGALFYPWFPVVFHLPQALLTLAQMALVFTVVEGALTLYTCYYRAVVLAHCQHQWANVADTVYVVLANVTGLILLTHGAGFLAFLVVRLAAAVLRFGWVAVVAYRQDSATLFPRAPFRFETFRKVTSLSLHAFVINLSVVISHKIDNFVIAAFMPLSAVGVFEIVFRFLGIALQISSKVCEVSLPMFSRLVAARDTDGARAFFLKMTSIANGCACFLLMSVLFFYHELLSLFSAGKVPLAATIPVLWVAVPSIWSGIMQMPAGYYLFSSGQQRFLSVTSIIAAFSNLALSLILIHPLGMVGVALGTLIPQLIQHQAGLIRKSCQELNIGFWEYLQAAWAKPLLPLLGVALWWAATHCVIGGNAFHLFGFILAAGIALCLMLVLWVRFSVTPAERTWILDKMVHQRRKLLPWVAS